MKKCAYSLSNTHTYTHTHESIQKHLQKLKNLILKTTHANSLKKNLFKTLISRDVKVKLTYDHHNESKLQNIFHYNLLLAWIDKVSHEWFEFISNKCQFSRYSNATSINITSPWLSNVKISHLKISLKFPIDLNLEKCFGLIFSTNKYIKCCLVCTVHRLK